MASFYQQRNGKWRADVYKQSVRRSKTFAIKADAELWACEQEQLIASKNDAAYFGKFRSGIDFHGTDLTEADVVLKSSPMGKHSGIYFLISKGKIVYVGKTSHLARRLIQHINDGVVYDRYTTMRCNIETATKLEKHYIAKFKPPLNKTLRRIA